jgi:amino acid transporter
VAQAIASGLFIVISSIGSSVHDMYMILLQTTIFLQLVPYLYMFGALILVRLRRNGVEPAPGFFSSNWVCYVSGTVGFIVTAGGVVLALVPPTLTADIFTFEFKLILGLASFLIPAFIIYYINDRRRQVLAPIALEIESVKD